MDELERDDGAKVHFERPGEPSDTAIVTMSGELDMSNIGRLDAIVSPALSESPTRLIVEVSVERLRHTVRIEVTDAGGGKPTMRSPGPQDPFGRGLRIVDMLSDSWGVDYDPPRGKTVWFTLKLPQPSARRSAPLSGRG